MGKLTISNKTDQDDDIEQQEDAGLPKQVSQDADIPLTLEQFRALVGIPQERLLAGLQQYHNQDGPPHTTTEDGFLPAARFNPLANLPPPIRPATITSKSFSNQGSRVLIFLRLFSRPGFTRRSRFKKGDNMSEAQEYATSLYYTLLREESDQTHLYHIYNIIVYTCLILQLVIASALIIIGAIPTSAEPTRSGHRIAIAVLGAVTGVLSGVLSLLNGQGFPSRLLQYATRLRQVRDKIEFCERSLRANISGVIVTYDDVVEIWTEFETVRNENGMKRPDVWAIAGKMGDGGAGFMKMAQRGATAAKGQMAGFARPETGANGNATATGQATPINPQKVVPSGQGMPTTTSGSGTPHDTNGSGSGNAAPKIG